MSDRLVSLEGTQNFRDIGGYPTASGGTVRRGLVYRADALSTLTEPDLATLGDLGLRLVIDFRGEEEITLEPGPFREHQSVRYVHTPIGENASPAEWRARFESGDLGDLDEGWLSRTYVAMLDARPEVFATVLAQLAADAALPAVFHCTAGKDRTGVMAMLILSLLGVPHEHVIADYALTAHYTKNKIKAANRWFGEQGIDIEKTAHLFSARPENIQSALNHLDNNHGGVERYAKEAMRVDDATLEALRQNLIEH